MVRNWPSAGMHTADCDLKVNERKELKDAIGASKKVRFHARSQAAIGPYSC